MNLDSKIKEEHFPPCYHCGYCCNATPCWIAWKLNKVDKETNKCQLLYEENKQFFCKLVKSVIYKKALFIKEGCCSNLNSLRKQMILNGFKSKNSQDNNIFELF